MNRLTLGLCGSAVAVLALLVDHVPPARSSAGWILDAPFDTEVAPERAELARGESGTYIGAILAERDSLLLRWRDRPTPIRVWIEHSSGAAYDEDVRDAFDEWIGTGIPIHVGFVDRAIDAEIRVRWTERPVAETGNTTWRADVHGWLVSADVLLSTRLRNGRILDDRSMHALALHEIGHALGLGHSTDRLDLMAPVVRVPELSRADGATARLIYSLPAGRLR